MSESMYDANCDIVIEMQELGVGVEEILQYARGCFGRDELRALSAGLERMTSQPEPVLGQFYG